MKFSLASLILFALALGFLDYSTFKGFRVDASNLSANAVSAPQPIMNMSQFKFNTPKENTGAQPTDPVVPSTTPTQPDFFSTTNVLDTIKNSINTGGVTIPKNLGTDTKEQGAVAPMKLDLNNSLNFNSILGSSNNLGQVFATALREIDNFRKIVLSVLNSNPEIAKLLNLANIK